MFGKELILDLHNCNPEKFNRKDIEQYFIELCELIDMEREDLYWWDYEGMPKEYAKAPPHLKGISAVQFISTSNIVIHTLDDLKRCYINIFSCKDFNEMQVFVFSEKFFEGKVVNYKTIERL